MLAVIQNKKLQLEKEEQAHQVAASRDEVDSSVSSGLASPDSLSSPGKCGRINVPIALFIPLPFYDKIPLIEV